jgi:hypothetical protein
MDLFVFISPSALKKYRKAEIKARRGAASICEGAYMDVRNRMGTEPQRRIAKYIRRLQNGGDASETRRGEYLRGRVHRRT